MFRTVQLVHKSGWIRPRAIEAHAAEHQVARDEAAKAFWRLNAAAGRMKEVVEPEIAQWRQEPNPALKALERGR